MIWLLRMRDEHRGTWHALDVDDETIDCELCMQTSAYAPRALCGARPSDGECWHDAAAGAYIADAVCGSCLRVGTGRPGIRDPQRRVPEGPCYAPIQGDPRPCGLARGHDGEHRP